MGQKPRARGPAKSLKPAVQSPEKGKEQNRGGEAKKDVEEARQQKPQSHDHPRVGPIGEKAAGKLAHPIGDIEDASQDSQLAFGKAQLRNQARHGIDKALPCQVVTGIADDHRVEDPDSPVAVETFYLLFVLNLREIGRRKEKLEKAHQASLDNAPVYRKRPFF